MTKQDALQALENLVKSAIEAKSDDFVNLLVAEIEKQTPAWADALIEGQKAAFAAFVKEELLKLADGIAK